MKLICKFNGGWLSDTNEFNLYHPTRYKHSDKIEFKKHYLLLDGRAQYKDPLRYLITLNQTRVNPIDRSLNMWYFEIHYTNFSEFEILQINTYLNSCKKFRQQQLFYLLMLFEYETTR